MAVARVDQMMRTLVRRGRSVAPRRGVVAIGRRRWVGQIVPCKRNSKIEFYFRTLKKLCEILSTSIADKSLSIFKTCHWLSLRSKISLIFFSAFNNSPPVRWFHPNTHLASQWSPEILPETRQHPYRIQWCRVATGLEQGWERGGHRKRRLTRLFVGNQGWNQFNEKPIQ